MYNKGELEEKFLGQKVDVDPDKDPEVHYHYTGRVISIKFVSDKEAYLVVEDQDEDILDVNIEACTLVNETIN